MINLTVNGRQVVADVPGDWTLLRFLREQLRLTGTKQGCDGEGTCGACTVIVDGEAVRSCRIKMSEMEGRIVETIESLMRDGKPHVIQQAFIREHVFQCGYCASGVLMRVKALLDHHTDPTEKEIVRELSKHLCRCSGLVRGVAAVKLAAAALRGELDLGWTDRDTAVHHIMLERLTGRACYTDDIQFEGMLYGRALRSPLPHAEVISVEVKEAEQLPGVVRVLTAKDVPGENKYGLLIADQPIFCDRVVRYVGDCLALVVAETPEVAEAALEKIKVELRPLPVIATPHDAMAPGAPVLHDREDGPNILKHIVIRKGDVEAGFAQADVVVESDYHVGFIDHAFLETECSIGVPELDGSLTIYCGSQGPVFDRKQVAVAVGLPEDKVRIAHILTGGGFGGKEDVAGQVLAGVAAFVVGRPVKVRFSRQESIRVHHKRHAEWIHMKTGATKDGFLVAAEVKIIGDTGAYASTGEAVLFRSATFAVGPYVIPHARVDALAVHTNNPTCGAFRGFGSPQVCFAAEVQMDKLATALGMDPFELRMRNALDLGSATLTGHVLTGEVGVGVKECLQAVRATLDAIPRPNLEPPWKLGIGIAAAYKNVGLGSGIPDNASAWIGLQPDGTFLLRVGCTDLGQGSSEAMAIIAGRTLGVGLDVIKVHEGDTRDDPDAGMTTASRQTFVSGNAVLGATRKIRQWLWSYVSEEFGVPEEYIEIQDSKVFVNSQTGEVLLSLAELASRGQTFAANYHYSAPATQPVPAWIPADPSKEGTPRRLHFAYSFGAQGVMVAVNAETGEVRVLKVVAAHDAGKAVSMANCINQIQGAVVMGLGYALSETFQVEEGQIVTKHLKDLGLLRLRDLPEIEAIVIENPHPLGPYGAKGIGELAISPTAPAVVNAIHDAVGVWIDELPVTPERIVAAIKGQGGNKRK